jgi:hypothetical protein
LELPLRARGFPARKLDEWRGAGTAKHGNGLRDLRRWKTAAECYEKARDLAVASDDPELITIITLNTSIVAWTRPIEPSALSTRRYR